MSIAKHSEIKDLTVPENANSTGCGQTQEESNRNLELPEAKVTDYPLTLEQQRLWFLWKLQPNNPAYILQAKIVIEGRINLDLLKQAWLQVIQTHDALRARFGESDGQPYQSFVELEKLDFPIFDLVGIPKTKQDQFIQDAAGREINHPFALDQNPLFRLKGFQLSRNTVAVVFTAHEIVMDIRSATIITHQVKQFYFALLDGNPVPASRPPHSNFRHYACWESQNIQPDSLASQEKYWRENLAGKLPVLDLPTDTPRTETPSFRGNSESLLLDSTLSQQLKLLAESRGATLFMTLLTAFDILLYKYTGQEDLILGSPRINRNAPGTEELVGPFVNMLPLRVQIAASATCNELLDVVKQTVVNAYSHSNYPLLWMAGLTETRRNESRSPIFQTLFQMDAADSEDERQVRTGTTDECEFSFRELETGFTKYELTLDARERDGQIWLRLTYFSDLYPQTFIQRMLKNYEVVLRSIVEHPEAKIAGLEFVSSAEKQMLADLNQTHRKYHYDLSLSRLFEDQVEQTPEKTAFIIEDRPFSYRELNVRANQLARYLRKLGIKPGINVALCIDRSLEMLLGMLALMKLGAAYVPLDPDYPLARLEEIIKDTGTKYLVTQTSRDRFPDFTGEKVLIDQVSGLIEKEAGGNLGGTFSGDQVLNIIYTSSSTGKPKGVVISNKAVLNRLYWMWEDYPFHSDDVAVYHKSYALVAATWECFGALLKGIPTLMVTRADVLDPALLWQKLVKHRVSFFLATPALIQGILIQGELHPGAWSSLRLATTSAEPIPVGMVARWYRVFPDVPLLNLYGATECSSNATVYNTQELDNRARRVPLGKPLTNTRIYIINEHNQLAPYGVIGEMCVSGDCLASGYLNLPELNREKFGKNPFETGQSILYKSGDLARYRTDGHLDLVGRKDYQVKLRGFRIELGDIELALARHEAVRKCAVKFFAHDDGRQRLVAYIQSESSVSPSHIRSFLLQYLPDYMVPADYVFMDRLPLTLTGKVNRKALEEPADSQLELGNDFVPPQTDTEEFLVKVWKDLLRRPQVGIRNNFFDLGGHSLIATQMIAKVYQKYHVELPVRKIYESPTVFELAQAINAAVQNIPQTERPTENKQSRQRVPVTGIVPLTPAQAWYFSRWDGLIQPDRFNISRVFEVDSNFDTNKLKLSLTYIWKIHDSLRARFVRRGNYWKQIIADPDQSSFDYREYNLEDTPFGGEERTVEKYATLFQESINITKGPLMIIAYLNFGLQRPGRLILIVNHLVIDGNSIATLIKDLQTSYKQLRRGNAINLPEKSISIKEWAELIHEYLLSERYLQTIDYWLTLPWDEIPDLPMDYPQNRSKNLINSATEVAVALTEEDTTILTQKVPLMLNTEVDNILLWALIKVISEWTACKWVDISMMGSGHDMIPDQKHLDLSHTLGLIASFRRLVLENNKNDDLHKEIALLCKNIEKTPNKGYGYRMAAFLNDDVQVARRLQKVRRNEISFNYRGLINQVNDENDEIKLIRLSCGFNTNPQNNRYRTLDIGGDIINHCLTLVWKYSSNLHRRETIESLAGKYIQILKDLISKLQIDSYRSS
jgi:amino acid adenylation domain-containing protein/non-ribosomal peptide synthase protein (TIGR01720 family)